MSCGTSCGSGCGGCKVITALVALLITLITVAALLGVYVTHVSPDGWMFGTLNGSVALLTLLVSLKIWWVLVKKLCPCRSRGAGCGSGSGCGCGTGGSCSACGSNPCNCQ